MKATELHLADGKSAGIFYCGECRIVHRTQNEAEACCVPKRCRCGAELKPRTAWLICDVCRDSAEAKKDAEQYAAATKIKAEDWYGPVWCGVGGNEGYYASVDDLLEHFEDDKLPEQIYACTTHPICRLDYDSIIEHATQDAYEGWDPDQLTGKAELVAALTEFNERNKGEVCWQVDYKRAVVVMK